MRVIHVAAFHRPDDVRVFCKECRTLAQAGHEVTYAVVDPPAEAQDGVRFLPLPDVRSPSLPKWLWRAMRSVWKATRRERPELFHFHEADFIPIMLLHRLRGIRVVYDVHEDAPRQVRSRCRRLGVGWAAPVAGMVYGGMEWFARRCFDAFICATPTIAERFPKSRTLVVRNYPERDDLLRKEGESAAIPYGDRPNRVLYVGGLTVIRGVRDMVRAIDRLPLELDARLVLAGEFDSATVEEEMRGEPGWSKVDFLGWRTQSTLGSEFARARVGMVVLHPVANYLDAMPTKMFEYMAAGLPFIASDFPAWREMVGGEGCGLFVDPLDPDAVVEALGWLLTHPDEAEAMGRRGQAAVMERFNWQSQAEPLLELYRQMERH